MNSELRRKLDEASKKSYADRLGVLFFTTLYVAIPLSAAAWLGWWFVAGWLIGRVVFALGAIVANPSVKDDSSR